MITKLKNHYYNDNNLLVKTYYPEIIIGENSIQNGKIEEFKYDTKGQLIKQIIFDVDNDFKLNDNRSNTISPSYYQFTYDSIGNLIIKEFIFTDFWNSKSWKLSYDKQNNCTNIILYDFKTKATEIIKKFDSNNNMLNHTFISHNNISKKRIEKQYKYNIKGLVTEETNQTFLYDRKSELSIYKYTYEFDCFGNWTKKTKSDNNKIVLLQKREVEYYK